MNHPNLQELSQQIHKANKAAGWWDIPRPRVQTAWLVITELAEATEAERAGKYADLDAFEAKEAKNLRQLKGSKKSAGIVANVSFASAFVNHIKDTFEDEIADAVIRLLDFAASEGVVIAPPSRRFSKVENESIFFRVSDYCMTATRSNQKREHGKTAKAINSAISDLIALSRLRGFDLWMHVNLKLKYNTTRQKMHGGKKF